MCARPTDRVTVCEDGGRALRFQGVYNNGVTLGVGAQETSPRSSGSGLGFRPPRCPRGERVRVEMIQTGIFVCSAALAALAVACAQNVKDVAPHVLVDNYLRYDGAIIRIQGFVMSDGHVTFMVLTAPNAPFGEQMPLRFLPAVEADEKWVSLRERLLAGDGTLAVLEGRFSGYETPVSDGLARGRFFLDVARIVDLP